VPISFLPFLPDDDDATYLLESLFAESCHVDIAVGYLKNGGLDLIVEPLRRFLEHHTLRMLVSADPSQTDGEAVRTMLDMSPDCVRFFDVELPDRGIFHPKTFCFHTTTGVRVLLGSANLTEWAWKRNIEFNCLVTESPETRQFVRDLLSHFGRLWDLSSTISREALDWFIEKQKGVKIMPTFSEGDMVRSKSCPELGVGKVLEVEEVGGQKRATVKFPTKPEFLLFSDLVVDMAPMQWLKSYVERHAWPATEPFDLRTRARFLEVVNKKTGALTRTRVDVLPHQIVVAHRVVTSEPMRWLIADDVGLGKTIEAGLIITALHTKKKAERVLIVVPAGLTKQWQEELREKFGIKDFIVFRASHLKDYGTEPGEAWKRLPRVIASMDTLKQDGIRETLRDIQWDLVLFDEAHKLSAYREEEGGDVERVKRYRLAEVLSHQAQARANARSVANPNVGAMLFLTATPHQGKESKFFYLLNLIRPDVFKDEAAFEQDKRRFLSEMVIRNRKREVTDANEIALFKGLKTQQLPVVLTKAEQDFLSNLYDYLRQGYRVAASGKDTERAVGFVMTTFQKLASSSKAAIGHALQRRLEALTSKRKPTATRQRKLSPDELDKRTEDESIADHEDLVRRQAFFKDEVQQLRQVLASLRKFKSESKFNAFIKELRLCLKGNTKAKVLIFTEYRETQKFLVKELSERFGAEKVVQIHGGMPLDEPIALSASAKCRETKMQSALAFNKGDAQFLVSTEAGGEGINLQEQCHILFNYDLPWNPMRLYQRIGRLYRYGQTEDVQVRQFQQEGTIRITEANGQTRQVPILDQQISKVLGDCITRIVDSLAAINPNESPENIREFLLGELVEKFSFEKAYTESVKAGDPNKAGEMVEKELRAFIDTKQKFDELFGGLGGFRFGDYQSIRPEATMKDVQSFVDLFLKSRGGSMTLTDKGCYRVSVPSEVCSIQRKVRARYEPVTFSREVYQKEPNAHFLGFGHELLERIVEFCQDPKFEGVAAGRTVKSKEWKGVEGLQFNWVIPLRHDSTVVEEDFKTVFVDSAGKVRPDIGNALRLLPSSGKLSSTPRFLTVEFIDSAHETASYEADKAVKVLLKSYRKRHKATPVPTPEVFSVAAVRFI